MRLTKHHGLGNDFLVALVDDNPGLSPRADVAVAWCDRHRGVGADGFIWALAPTPDSGADATMVLHNADGSVAEISGNGIRCLGQAVLRRRGQREGRLVVDTAAGRRVLDSTATEDPAVDLLAVDMGPVSDGPPPGDWFGDLDPIAVAAIDIGNPHLVVHLSQLDGVDLSVAGPAIEEHVAGGVNVHFLVVSAPDEISLLHWERGVGITAACGSGASVSAVAAHRWGLVGSNVSVVMPGGRATVEVGETVRLTGPATSVAEVNVA